MYDYTALRRIIKIRQAKKYGINESEIARELGITASCLSRKLHGKSQFTQSEISKLVKLLSLPHDLIGEYFFTEEVKKC